PRSRGGRLNFFVIASCRIAYTIRGFSRYKASGVRFQSRRRTMARAKKKSKGSRKRSTKSRKSSAARKVKRTARARAGASRKTSARKRTARKGAAKGSKKRSGSSRKSSTAARRPKAAPAAAEPSKFVGATEPGSEGDEMLVTEELIEEADIDLGGDEGGDD